LATFRQQRVVNGFRIGCRSTFRNCEGIEKTMIFSTILSGSSLLSLEEHGVAHFGGLLCFKDLNDY